MAQAKNPILRVVFAFAMLVLAVVAGWAITKNTGRPASTGTPPIPASAAATPPITGGAPVGNQTDKGATTAPAAPPGPAPAATPSTVAAAPATGALSARAWPGEPLASNYEALGSTGKDSAQLMRIEFSPLGAGVRSIKMARDFDDLKDTVHTEIQRAIESQDSRMPNLVPMAALWADVNGAKVFLVGATDASVWKQRAGHPGVLDAEIVDAAGTTVLKIERRYELPDDSYRMSVRQTVSNVSGAPVTFKWHQLGPIDLAGEATAYGGDRRRVRFGYLLGPTADPSRRAVVSNEFIQDHQVALGSPDRATGLYSPEIALWPNVKSTERTYDLVWTALTSRYFGVAVHPYPDPTVQVTGSLALPSFAGVDRIVWNRYKALPDGTQALDPVMALRLTSPEVIIPPQGSADLSFAVYAGPISRPVLTENAITKDYGLGGLVLFNMYTTAQWWCCCAWPPVGAVIEGISSVLFSLMHFLHDRLVHDWSLAIVLLVVCVRTALHPLTKWSQVRMQRFSKQMAAMGPKQKLIQERYKDDRKRLQEEVAKLYREEGFSPFGMLGCAPMVLVTPIWIGLYAMLYFAFELRHQPAFFGLVQRLFNGWSFLGDLSEPDRLYDFGRTVVTVPMLGPVHSINILPLILGAVFYVHQKYLTPPSAATLTPEQEMQQKMVKVMSVVMFPLFMYNAPCGLAIYFITNSTLAIFENKYIRAHIDKHDLMNPSKKPSKPGGIMARVLKAAEERARKIESSGNRPSKGKR